MTYANVTFFVYNKDKRTWYCRNSHQLGLATLILLIVTLAIAIDDGTTIDRPKPHF